MGVQGTAMASKAAGVVLMTNDLRRLADGVVGARRCTRVLATSIVVVLLLKLLPIVIMFSTESHGYLVVTAVGSDVVGIVYVLLSAMALMKMKPRFANMCRAAQSWRGRRRRCSRRQSSPRPRQHPVRRRPWRWRWSRWRPCLRRRRAAPTTPSSFEGGPTARGTRTGSDLHLEVCPRLVCVFPDVHNNKVGGHPAVHNSQSHGTVRRRGADMCDAPTFRVFPH